MESDLDKLVEELRERQKMLEDKKTSAGGGAGGGGGGGYAGGGGVIPVNISISPPNVTTITPPPVVNTVRVEYMVYDMSARYLVTQWTVYSTQLPNDVRSYVPLAYDVYSTQKFTFNSEHQRVRVRVVHEGTGRILDMIQ